MNQSDKKKIAACNRLIAGLENENRLQAELIDSQNAMIKTLEEQNKELTALLDEIFNSGQ